MPKRTHAYTVQLHTYGPDGNRRESETELAGLRDMLRYDVATITANPAPGVYRVTSQRPPTLDRWQSFGIRVVSEVSQ